MNRLKDNWVLLVILLFAAILRFWGLSNNPPSLNWDEISHGYNAYSILTTGKDEWGQIIPTIFRAFGDYKLPVYIYFTALSEAVFGLTPFAVRFVGALSGVLTVLFTYLLVLGLGNLGSLGREDRKAPALLTAFLVAVEPWSLFLSRGAFEANLALTLIVSGVFFFLLGLRKHWGFLISAILLGLSVWTYNSARVFVPMLLVWLAVVFFGELREVWDKKGKDRGMFGVSVAILAIFFLPMFWQMVNPEGVARYGKVEILDEGAILQIVEARNTSTLNPVLNRAVNNRVTYFAGEFGSNYVSHFSPKFLFVDGGDQYQFNVQGHGLIYWMNAIFLIVGIVYLIKERSKASALVIGWLLLAPVASSLTREAPHALRTIVMIPMPMILVSVGVVGFTNWVGKNAAKNKQQATNMVYLAYVAVVMIFLVTYLQRYIGEYRTNYSWSWQYGYEQAVDYAISNYDKYDKIVVTKKYGEPHEFFLFYQRWDPEEYRKDPNLVRFAQSDWFWVDGFDKYYFVNDWQIDEEGTSNYEFVLESKGIVECESNKCLLITSPGNVPEGWSLLDAVEFLDASKAFEIYEN